MSRRRALALFSIGLLVAAALAEVSARIAEAAGPAALRWYDTSTQLKVEQMDRLGETDVVFAGTSMVWQGLVPDSFTEADPDRRTAYNAGLAGGVPAVMEPWLLEEVTPRLDPDLVIWGLSSMDFSSSYGDDNLSRFRDALEGRTGTFASVEQTAARYSALVRYRSILRRPTALFGTGKAQIEQDFSEAAAVLGDSGERRDFAVDTGPERSRQVQARLRPYRIDPTDIDAIERTAAALRDRGIDVVFVEMPVPNRYVALHPEGASDVARGHEAITALGEILDIPVIDLRYGFADSDFVDFTHLTQEGAERLTISLAHALPGAQSALSPIPVTTTTVLEEDGATTTSIGPATTTTTTLPGPPTEVLISTANRAINVYDDLYHYLLGGGDILQAPAYWTSANHLGKHGDMANAVASGGFDVVMVGSSLVVNGFDPVRFSETDGRSSFNAGLGRLTPEELAIWLDSVLRLTDPDTVVIGLAPRDVRVLNRVEGACIDVTSDWEWSAQLQTSAFTPVDALDGLWWENLLFGDPVSFEAHSLYRSEYNEFGGRTVWPRSSTAEIQESADGGAWEGALPTCPERFEAIGSNITRLRDKGITTIVVLMPISGPRADMFEGGRDEIASILADIEAVAVSAGADAVIDFSGLLPDSEFRDLTHADATGARRLTDALVAALDALGFQESAE